MLSCYVMFGSALTGDTVPRSCGKMWWVSTCSCPQVKRANIFYWWGGAKLYKVVKSKPNFGGAKAACSLVGCNVHICIDVNKITNSKHKQGTVLHLAISGSHHEAYFLNHPPSISNANGSAFRVILLSQYRGWLVSYTCNLATALLVVANCQ